MKKMLRNLFMSFVTLGFVCCTSNDEITTKPIEQQKTYKNTEVYLRGNCPTLSRALTFDTKGEEGYDIPFNGCYKVFYYIRIDGNIPGENESNCKSDEYFPQTAAKKTMVDDLNMGSVKSDVDWKHNFKFSKYIYDPTGGKIQDIIVEEPTLEDLVNANKSDADFRGYLKHKNELKFIWYACKKQDSDHVWHIDGILTSSNKKDVSETIYGDEITGRYTDIEVDIHEQDHKDWGEIKTTVHVRSVTNITITLPIEGEFVEPADDFAIRTYDYEKITAVDNVVNFNNLKITVVHGEGKTLIKIAGVTADLLKDNGGEITVEVHTYYKVLSDEELWLRLSKSKIDVTEKNTGVYGQIHYKDSPKEEWIKL